jgi:hypothetical protein
VPRGSALLLAFSMSTTHRLKRLAMPVGESPSATVYRYLPAPNRDAAPRAFSLGPESAAAAVAPDVGTAVGVASGADVVVCVGAEGAGTGGLEQADRETAAARSSVVVVLLRKIRCGVPVVRIELLFLERTRVCSGLARTIVPLELWLAWEAHGPFGPSVRGGCSGSTRSSERRICRVIETSSLVG